MSAWDAYENRIHNRGGSLRRASLLKESGMLLDKLPDSLSYHHVTIDGNHQRVAIINSDNLNEKSIISMPGEDITHGGLVEWMDNRWLVTERDANTTVYTKAKMLQCNHLLKWVDDDNVIHEQWCVVEDGTKLRRLVSAQRNLRVKISIELPEHPKAYIATA